MSEALVRNMEAGPTVFEWEGGKGKVEWAGAGDPMGGDLQPVPAEYLTQVNFRQALVKGIFAIEDAPEAILQATELHRQEWQIRQDMVKANAAASLDQAPQNDMLMLACIGPSGKGSGTLCGYQVPVRARAKNDSPPLCGAHKGLASQFIAEESEQLVDGKPDIRWIRAGMGNRTKQN